MKTYTITVNGNVYEVSVEEGSGSASAPVAAAPKAAPVAPKAAPAAPAASGSEGSVKVVSPMPGKILGVKVKVGDVVKKGQDVVILEAMKMENNIPAPEDGTVASVNVSTGAAVEAGDVLVTLN